MCQCELQPDKLSQWLVYQPVADQAVGIVQSPTAAIQGGSPPPGLTDNEHCRRRIPRLEPQVKVSLAPAGGHVTGNQGRRASHAHRGHVSGQPTDSSDNCGPRFQIARPIQSNQRLTKLIHRADVQSFTVEVSPIPTLGVTPSLVHLLVDDSLDVHVVSLQ